MRKINMMIFFQFIKFQMIIFDMLLQTKELLKILYLAVNIRLKITKHIEIVLVPFNDVV